MLVFRASAKNIIASFMLLAVTGCGTMRTTDTRRTATEQLLVSDAIDSVVETIDFRPLTGQTVYFDESRFSDIVDRNYLISSVRQHLLASGCILKESKIQADFIIEGRAGAVGTDRHNLLYGVPATNLPQMLSIPGVPTVIPEVPIAKRSTQRGIAKISLFAYHRETGRSVWQSGLVRQDSTAQDLWVLGAGPFQNGTIYDGTNFAGVRIKDPIFGKDEKPENRTVVGLRDNVVFISPSSLNPLSEKEPTILQAQAITEIKPIKPLKKSSL